MVSVICKESSGMEKAGGGGNYGGRSLLPPHAPIIIYCWSFLLFHKVLSNQWVPKN